MVKFNIQKPVEYSVWQRKFEKDIKKERIKFKLKKSVIGH